MPAVPEFQQYQFAFAKHIRDPKSQPRPKGVPAKRMGVYNELLYNNIEGFLLACFPVLHRILGKRKWAKMVREFFANHRCHTPFFRQIPDEFLKYLNQRGLHPDEYPFMLELAHYEWIELSLSVSPKEADFSRIDEEGDLLQEQPVLNPVLAIQSYKYPVHRISPRFKPGPDQQEETHFVIFRNQENEVKFIVLNPVSLRLLALLQSSEKSGHEALIQIASELGYTDPAPVIEGGKAILESLCAAQAILGVRAA